MLPSLLLFLFSPPLPLLLSLDESAKGKLLTKSMLGANLLKISVTKRPRPSTIPLRATISPLPTITIRIVSEVLTLRSVSALYEIRKVLAIFIQESDLVITCAYSCVRCAFAASFIVTYSLFFIYGCKSICRVLIVANVGYYYFFISRVNAISVSSVIIYNLFLYFSISNID